MRDHSYPASVAEVLDDHLRFNARALVALRRFKQTRPWSGLHDDRVQKLQTLHRMLCAAYELDPAPRLIFANDGVSCSGNSAYFSGSKAIVLRGRLSVLTYLHELAHARAMGEARATKYSVNLFRRVFPRQYARCRHEGHMLRAPRRLAGGPEGGTR